MSHRGKSTDRRLSDPKEPCQGKRRRSSRSAMVTGHGTAALCGPHHATWPTMRSSAGMGLGG